MKKILSLVLTLVIVLSIGGCTPAANGPGNDNNDMEDIVVRVLYTNDVHAYIDKNLNYTLVAQYRDSLENVLLVDAGDHIQGTAYGSMDKGKSVIGLMNLAGYDLATLGNYEFNYGMEGALNAIEWADFPYVCCNFYHINNGVKGENVLDSYKVFEVGGMKIAFIGITTPETFTNTTPGYFQDEYGNFIYGIAGGHDGSELYAAVQEAIDKASEEADVVIALGHLGVDHFVSPWTGREVIENTVGLDAFIDGHSHTVIPMEEVSDAEGNTVILTQAGSYFDNLGQMTITAGGITTELLTANDINARLAEVSGSEPNPELNKAEQDWIDEVNGRLGQVIGTIDAVLNNYNADGVRLVRGRETNAGDFAADAMYYLFDNMDIPVDVAFINGGGIRNVAITGDISYLTCKLIHPFGNVACLIEVTGQQILDALEMSARGTEADMNDPEFSEISGFFQVSGCHYTIDTSIPSSVSVDDNGVFQSVNGEYRVRDVEILDRDSGEYKPLEPDKTYNLAGFNYTLRDCGDGHSMLRDSVVVLDYVMEDYMVLANYVQSFADTDGDGLPNVTGYSEIGGDGRITVADLS